MLYILPPPSASNSPTAWNGILCGNAGNGQNAAGPGLNNGDSMGDNGGGGGPTSNLWGMVQPSDKRPPVRGRISPLAKRLLLASSNDSGTAVSTDDDETKRSNKSLSECYFAGKGAALVLPPHERLGPSRRVSASGSDIQQHLQSMFYLLRPEETLKMAVKLESGHAGRTRYLVVVSCIGRQDAEESCLLGIDCNERTTVGLVLRVLADTNITLDGDGGFSVCVCGRQHIFKPVSVQAMWSALQTLHKVSSKAREQNYFLGGLTHDWVSYYEQRIESDRSCLNEWHAMDNLESRRPPSPDSVRTKPRERDETERVIRATLKEIMMSVDLDEVTSKYIRSRLEEDLDMDLGEFKSFIDQEMLTILGQMDAPTEIFDHVYLGSEWNASNLEELQKNGVRHILNVTREIDNFFPGMFDYLNIRVYDDEKTDLLKHWDNTFKYITRAKKEGSKVLVHCKMGVSRSASVVIAYAMKAYNWDFDKALKHVKEKRNCIKPNTSFLAQLETYQGILDAMKNREKLQRSKSETNLKSPGLVTKNDRIISGSEPTPITQALNRAALQPNMSGQEMRQFGGRPKSWSPDNQIVSHLYTLNVAPTSVSLEHLNRETSKINFTATTTMPLSSTTTTTSSSSSEKSSANNTPPTPPISEVESRNVLMPCENGQAYSVSQNQIFHLPSCKTAETDSTIPSVKHRVIELESQTGTLKNGVRNQPDKKGLVLNLTSQFECSTSKQSSPQSSDEGENTPCFHQEIMAPTPTSTSLTLSAVIVKKEIWDPGERSLTNQFGNVNCKPCDLSQNSDSLVWTSSTRLIETTNATDSKASDFDLSANHNSDSETSDKLKQTVVRRDGDPFSNQLDRVFDREERKQRHSIVGNLLPQCGNELSDNLTRECPSRQSSWSSYDSAVVLGFQGESRETPSRHSSWGSGDARVVPSRNSSWGSYDIRAGAPQLPFVNESSIEPQMEDLFVNSPSGMFAYDKEEFPAYPGTVKRTKQKLEESNSDIVGNSSENSSSAALSETKLGQKSDFVETFNVALVNHCESSNDLIRTKKIDINKSMANKSNMYGSRLSVSAPERTSLTFIPTKKLTLSNSVSNISKYNADDCDNGVVQSVKQHKIFLESLNSKSHRCSPRRFFSVEETSDSENRNLSGIVKILKREFEAKTGTNMEAPEETLKPQKVKGSSLPSSPIIAHVNIGERDSSNLKFDPSEDLSVKKLVDKYEESKISDEKINSVQDTHNAVTKSLNREHRPKSTTPVQRMPPPKSALLERNLKNGCDADGLKRPPKIPPTVVKSSMSPSVVLANVVTNAANKKQQQQYGKTHPLSRLTINKQRHHNPVYNTM